MLYSYMHIHSWASPTEYKHISTLMGFPHRV